MIEIDWIYEALFPVFLFFFLRCGLTSKLDGLLEKPAFAD